LEYRLFYFPLSPDSENRRIPKYLVIFSVFDEKQTKSGDIIMFALYFLP
jgi:hypothetical protein